MNELQKRIDKALYEIEQIQQNFSIRQLENPCADLSREIHEKDKHIQFWNGYIMALEQLIETTK